MRVIRSESALVWMETVISAANHKDGLDQAFLERSAREFRTFGFAEAGKCGFGLGDGHTPFDVPEAIRIALAIEVLRLAREQRQRDRREEKKPHYLSMSDLDGFRRRRRFRSQIEPLLVVNKILHLRYKEVGAHC